MENVILGGNVVSLPEELCENKQLFNEVVSFKTFNEELSNEQKQRLFDMLPNFPEDDESEKIETLKRMFGGENFKFGNQRNHLFKKLNEGLLSPSIAKLSKTLKKAAYKEYRLQNQQNVCKLLKQILHSRKLLLDAAQYSSPSSNIPKISDSSKDDKPNNGLEDRARWRYFSELQEIREECGELETSSEDENYPGPPPKLSRKHKKHLQFLESSLSPDMHRISSTTAPPTRIGHYSVSPRLAILDLSEDSYRAMIQEHQRRRASGELHPELDTSKVTLEGVMQRTSVARRPSGKSDNSSSKKKSKQKPSSSNQSHLSVSQPKPEEALSNVQLSPAEIKSSPPHENILPESIACPTPSPSVPTQITSQNLLIEESNSVTQVSSSNELPLEEMDVDVGSDVEGQGLIMPRPTLPPEMENVKLPSSFFTLLRDLFYELPEQKMTVSRLEERVKTWMDNPVPGIGDWVNHYDNWVELVSSALKFLAGDLPGIQPENFVPYLDYREKQQNWQWIGAGRDTDDHLNPLCQHWLENKDELGLDSLESCQGSPPPARVATDWTVKPASEEEKSIYRHQENIRYQNPHKAFTFRVHGYESVVGPVKGVYGKESGVNKAREHSLLVSDRPPFVTILSLVRDSAARLPNGEGTRADICEILKDSQYIAAASDQQIHTVVSGALDRLHYEKDPCVKYDTNRKLWIYLHRHRTEEEFEKIHNAQAAAAMARKKLNLQKSKPARIVKPKDPRWLSPNSNAVSLQQSAAESSNNLESQTSCSKSSISSKISQTINSRRTSAQSQSGIQNVVGSNSNITDASKPEPLANQISKTISATQIACSTVSASPIIPLASKATLQGVMSLQQNPLKQAIPETQNQLTIANQTKQEPFCNTIELKQTQESLQNFTTTPHVTTTLSIGTANTPTTCVTDLPSFSCQHPILQSVAQAALQRVSVNAANIQNVCSKTQPAVIQCAAKRTAPSAVQSFQTIVIKQDQAGKSTMPILTANRTPTIVGTKPVVARLVSGTQVVSLSNLMSGFGEVNATALRFQGANYGQSGNAVLQSGASAGNRLPTFTLPGSQVGIGQLSTQSGNLTTRALVVDQEKQTLFSTAGGTLKLVTNPTALQQLPAGLKVQQTNKSVSNPGTNVVTMTTTGSLTSMLLAGSNPVMLASQASLKPTTQTYVMAATGSSPAVVMATSQQTVRGMKTLQGIKVIPVSQAVGTLRGANKTQQPLVARIITPSAGITLQQASGSSATAVGLVQSLSSVAGVQKGGVVNQSKPATISLTTASGQQPVIIKMHASELTPTSTTNVPNSDDEIKKG